MNQMRNILFHTYIVNVNAAVSAQSHSTAHDRYYNNCMNTSSVLKKITEAYKLFYKLFKSRYRNWSSATNVVRGMQVCGIVR